MNRSIPILALFAALSLTACNKPTVVAVPTEPAAVPGPAGPQGASGASGVDGMDGNKGDTGKSGEGTTVIVVPPTASAPAN